MAIVNDDSQEVSEPNVPRHPRWLPWKFVTVTESVNNCGSVLGLVHKESGSPVRIETNCDSWRHRTCGSRKARESYNDIRHLWSKVYPLEKVWVATYEFDESNRVRVKTRSCRRDAEHLAIRRMDGTFHLFADKDLSGKLTPTVDDGEWMPVTDAVVHLANEALAMPGVLRISWSKNWGAWLKGEPPKPTGRYWSTGKWSRKVWERAVKELFEQLGIENEDDLAELIDPETFRLKLDDELHRQRELAKQGRKRVEE